MVGKYERVLFSSGMGADHAGSGVRGWVIAMVVVKFMSIFCINCITLFCVFVFKYVIDIFFSIVLNENALYDSIFQYSYIFMLVQLDIAF